MSRPGDESHGLPRVPQHGGSTGTESTTELLRGLIARCACCGQSLSGHSYRFFASHPAASDSGSPEQSAARDFLATVERGDWAAVQAHQQPTVDEPRLVVYVLSCSTAVANPPAGGMAVMLGMEDGSAARLLIQQALRPEELTAVRALCPACPWIPLINRSG